MKGRCLNIYLHQEPIIRSVHVSYKVCGAAKFRLLLLWLLEGKNCRLAKYQRPTTAASVWRYRNSISSSFVASHTITDGRSTVSRRLSIGVERSS